MNKVKWGKNELLINRPSVLSHHSADATHTDPLSPLLKNNNQEVDHPPLYLAIGLAIGLAVGVVFQRKKCRICGLIYRDCSNKGALSFVPSIQQPCMSAIKETLQGTQKDAAFCF